MVCERVDRRENIDDLARPAWLSDVLQPPGGVPAHLGALVVEQAGERGQRLGVGVASQRPGRGPAQGRPVPATAVAAIFPRAWDRQPPPALRSTRARTGLRRSGEERWQTCRTQY